MGNHDVGRTMATAAEVYWRAVGERVPTQEEALAVLDLVGAQYQGADAEFDDELSQPSALSRLVAIAFSATEVEVKSLTDEEDGDHWYSGPYTRFRNHFRFC